MNCKHTIQLPLPFKHKSQHGVHLTLLLCWFNPAQEGNNSCLMFGVQIKREIDCIHKIFCFILWLLSQTRWTNQSKHLVQTGLINDQWLYYLYNLSSCCYLFLFLIRVHDLAYGQLRFLQPSCSCEGIDFIWNGFLLLIFWIPQRVLGRLSTTKVFFSFNTHCNSKTQPILTFSLY